MSLYIIIQVKINEKTQKCAKMGNNVRYRNRKIEIKKRNEISIKSKAEIKPTICRLEEERDNKKGYGEKLKFVLCR